MYPIFLLFSKNFNILKIINPNIHNIIIKKIIFSIIIYKFFIFISYFLWLFFIKNFICFYQYFYSEILRFVGGFPVNVIFGNPPQATTFFYIFFKKNGSYIIVFLYFLKYSILSTKNYNIAKIRKIELNFHSM